MVLGENAYDIVPGFVGAPVGSFSEHMMAAVSTGTAPPAASDEDLLAKFLLESL
jgi:hypothetical protein